MVQPAKTALRGAVDRDHLGYESSFNPDGEYHDGPRTTDNTRTLSPDKRPADEDRDSLS